MSQNANTLILFFPDKLRHEHCVLAFYNLMRDEDETSRRYQRKLGVDLSSHWHEQWFNHEVKATPRYIRVDFDTANGEGVPYALLHSLFRCGLGAAVFEVFHDQVGEVQRFHFMADQLVSRDHLFEAAPEIEPLAAEAMRVGNDEARQANEDDALEDEDDGCVVVQEPVPIRTLIENEQRSSEDAAAMVEDLLNLTKAARESGTNPIALARNVLVVRALVRGLGHSALFTVATVLLFKGMWLWLGIGLALAVALPLVYVNGVVRDFAEPKAEQC